MTAQTLKTEIRSEFGKQVRAMRTKRGWTLLDLAKNIEGGSNSTFLSAVENNRRSVSLKTVSRIINALDMHTLWLERYANSLEPSKASGKIIENEPEDTTQNEVDFGLFDFDFDVAKKWLRAVHFDDDFAHLRDEDRVQGFLDDIGELRDGLRDFSDFAGDLKVDGNRTVPVVRSAERILDELDYTEDKSHIRARRLIELGSYLHGFSLEENQRNALGPTLSQMVDDNVERLQTLCERHFGPSLEKLHALDAIMLEDDDPDEILDALHKVLEVAQAADGTDLVPLDPEALALLSKMVTELTEQRTAIDEAKTDAHRETLRDKFARSSAAITATFGLYIDRSKEHATRSAARVDVVQKQFKRAKGFRDLWEFLEKVIDSGVPPRLP